LLKNGTSATRWVEGRMGTCSTVVGRNKGNARRRQKN